MEPNPPIIHPTKDLIGPPHIGINKDNGRDKDPATPPIMEAMAQVTVLILLTLIPIRIAPSRFWAMARMPVPSTVNLKKRKRRSIKTIETGYCRYSNG